MVGSGYDGSGWFVGSEQRNLRILPILDLGSMMNLVRANFFVQNFKEKLTNKETDKQTERRTDINIERKSAI